MAISHHSGWVHMCSFALFPFIPISWSVRQHLGNLRIHNNLYPGLEQPGLVEGILKFNLGFFEPPKGFAFFRQISDKSVPTKI